MKWGKRIRRWGARGIPRSMCLSSSAYKKGGFLQNPPIHNPPLTTPTPIRLHLAIARTLTFAVGTRGMVHTLASHRNPGRSPLPTLGTYGAVSPSSLPRRRRAHTGVEHPEIHKLVDRGPNQPMELLVERAACPPLPLRSLGPGDPICRFVDRRNRPSKVLDN